MAFTNKDVMDLRQRTGVGMMDCKKALVETDGDMDKAIEYLREKGIAKAAKKAGRVAAEGAVCSIIENDTGVLLEVNCETDFVSRGDQFKALAAGIAKQILAGNATDVEALLDEKSIDGNGTVKDVVIGAIAKIGENISVRRFEKYVAKSGIVDTYIHLGGKVGVLVEVDTDKTTDAVKALVHDISLQIAAMKPEFVCEKCVSAEKLAKEREILFVQAKNENEQKPDAVIEKMVDGRIKKFYEETCLLNQKFFKDPTKSISAVIAEVAKAEGATIAVKRFVRFEMGEGIAKREDDLAAEVNAQIAQMSK